MKLYVCTAMIGAALFAGTPLAYANGDPAANPPACSAADLEFVRAGVQQRTVPDVRPSDALSEKALTSTFCVLDSRPEKR